MRSLVIILVFACCSEASAITGRGLVVTKTDSIYGEIKIDLEKNRVNVKGSDNRYHSFLAAQIDRIIIGRGLQQKNYASAVFGADSDVYLFEILSEGDVSLLYREGVKFSRFDQETFPPYFAYIGNSLYSLGGKKEFFEIFGEAGKSMRDFIKDQGLKYGILEDMIAIFNHYNGVEGSEIFALKD